MVLTLMRYSEELVDIGAGIGRPVVERTTVYARR